MKLYVTITGVVFGVVVLLHVWRATVERHLFTDPTFIAITLAAASLSVWAFTVLRASTRSER